MAEAILLRRMLLTMWIGPFNGGGGVFARVDGFELRKKYSTRTGARFGFGKVRCVAVDVDAHIAGLEVDDSVGVCRRII